MWKLDLIKWLIENPFSKGIKSILAAVADLTRAVQDNTTKQEQIMADVNQIKADMAATKENLVEIGVDLAKVKGLSETQAVQIGTLEAAIEALKAQVGDLAELDAVAAAAADLKASSRSIADVVAPEPEPEPEAPVTPEV